MIGFIGIGNMGGTLAKVAARAVGKENILVSSRTGETARKFAAEHGFTAVENAQIAERADMIFLGVKPHQMRDLLKSLSDILSRRRDKIILVSMAAGLTTEQLEEMLGGSPAIVRIMPNTPSLIGKGSIPYCSGSFAEQTDVARVCAVLQDAGECIPLSESLMDAASAVSGCGPAFVYVFIEALADAGVASGLPRATALALAAQTVCGAAEMVLQTGLHPAALKDAVCSPGGSTITGVCALDEGGFRAAAQKAVLASYRRNLQLGE